VDRVKDQQREVARSHSFITLKRQSDVRETQSRNNAFKSTLADRNDPINRSQVLPVGSFIT